MSAVENCADGYSKCTSTRATLPTLIVTIAARMASNILALAIGAYWASMPPRLFKVVNRLFVCLEGLEKIEDVHGCTVSFDALRAWRNTGGNANIVPVVANGRVFVASYKQLTIFGLGGHKFVASAAAAAEPAALDTNAPPHEITGVLEHAAGPVLTLQTRAGKIVQVDDSDALRSGQTGVLVPGNAYTVQGTTYDSTGALHAQAVGRAKDSPAFWPPDR